MYAEILIPQKIGTEKETLTYEIPENLNPIPGQAVKISLRKKILTGVVWSIHNEKPEFRTIPIISLAEYDGSHKPLLSTLQLRLLDWMSHYYFCPLHKLLKYFIPTRILENRTIPKKLLKNPEEIQPTGTKKLTKEQERIFLEIKSKSLNKFLIHGITGSGKTEIYTHLAKEQLQQNRQVLILVPEIALTPQIIEYFEKSLGFKAGVIHSKISEGEKQLTWTNIFANKMRLIIGSRSAIFAPFQELGLIIIDEEHELSYKQDKAPRYTIHRLVEKMQELNPEIKAVLGSATPSVETAEKLKDTTLSLQERIGKSTLPQIEIVDLRDEFKKHNFSIFSERLQEEIKNILSKKEQAILFLNRRGSASSIVCRDCGYICKCPDCEIALTYHAKTLEKPKLICHHCGKISEPPATCPQCKGANIRFLGIGTQKIEAELIKAFPQARILRADKDTTNSKHGFEEIYRKFKNHEADILVGTQMIAKGLHLPKVNLVGVVLADIGLNIPDFRTSERNFQLMTQVSGRAGRAGNDGKVIIQTYNPDNFALLCTAENNYEKFLGYERTQRKLLKNPPFGQLAKILIEHKSLNECRNMVEKMENNLWKIFREHEKNDETLEITSYPAYLTRLRGKYRYILLLKSPAENLIHEILEKLPKEDIINTSIKIDVDPINTT